MSLTDLAALFKAAGDSDAVRDGIQAFVEETLIEPEKLGEEEAVAKRAFVQLLNASGGVDVARMSFDAAHAEHENKNESLCDEDAKKLEVQVQEAPDGLTTATALMETEKAKLLEFIFLLVKGRAMGNLEQNVESKEEAVGVKKDVASEDVLSSPRLHWVMAGLNGYTSLTTLHRPWRQV